MMIKTTDWRYDEATLDALLAQADTLRALAPAHDARIAGAYWRFRGARNVPEARVLLSQLEVAVRGERW
jgi:hypothetical protein